MIRLLTQKTRAFAKEQSGAAMVEFAIALPILLLVLAIIIEGTRFAYAHQAAASGLRDASRYVSRVAAQDPCDTVDQAAANTALQTQFGTRVSEIVQYRMGTQGETVLPGGITVTSVTPSLICKTVDYNGNGISVVEVTATLNVQLIFGGVFGIFNERRDGFTTSISDQSRIFGI